MNAQIDIYVRRLVQSGRTLVVVQFDREWTYGAAELDPISALNTAAQRAVEGVARSGRNVGVAAIVALGHVELGGAATALGSSEPSRCDVVAIAAAPPR